MGATNALKLVDTYIMVGAPGLVKEDTALNIMYLLCLKEDKRLESSLIFYSLDFNYLINYAII